MFLCFLFFLGKSTARRFGFTAIVHLSICQWSLLEAALAANNITNPNSPFECSIHEMHHGQCWFWQGFIDFALNVFSFPSAVSVLKGYGTLGRGCQVCKTARGSLCFVILQYIFLKTPSGAVMSPICIDVCSRLAV